MAINVDKTKFKRIPESQLRAFAYRNKSGYEFEFDEEGNWIAPVADIGSNDRISIPSVLGLSDAQKAGLALSIDLNLQGYHKRLTNQENADISVEVQFSLESEQVIIELKTQTDPPLYSEFVIEIANLTNENGEPQQAEVKLQGTWDLHQETGYIDENTEMDIDDMAAFLGCGPLYLSGQWEDDGYHYHDKEYGNRHFWPSIEEKRAAVEKTQTVDAKEERITTKQISNTDKTTLFEMVGPMLILAKAFTLVKEVVSDFVKYMESQPSANDASVSTPVASSSVVEKHTADSQNRYGLFAIIGAAGKMFMNAFTIEAASRNLAPSDEIKPPTFGQ